MSLRNWLVQTRFFELKPCLLGVIFAGLTVFGNAQAQTGQIGSATRVQNSVAGIVSGRSTTLSDGSAVYSNELVKTEADSLAKLTFNDKTNLSVGPSSQVKLDRFVFDASRSTSSAVISMSTGAFRFVTGSSDPRNFKLTTPAASIGIRGTILDIDNTATKTTVVLVEGAARVCTRANPQSGLTADKPKCTDLTEPGQYVTVQTNGVISPALPGGPAVFQFANLCSGGNAEICATFKTPVETAGLSGFTTPTLVFGTAVVGASIATIVAANQKDKAPFIPAPPPPAPPLTPQTINFAPLANQTLPGPPGPLVATATSGLPVSFFSNTPAICSVTGSTVQPLAPGQCSIVAFQNGDATFAPAPNVTQSFNVVSAINVINFPNPGPTMQSNTPLQLNATADSGDQVIYTSTTPAICQIDGADPTMVDLLAVGTCSITANDPGNPFYPAATPVSVSFNVLINSNTITFNPPNDTPLNTGPVTVNAFATSGLPVTFTSLTPAICTVSGTSVTLVAVGFCNLQAASTGNTLYSPPAPVTAGFNVQPAAAAPVAASFAVNVPYQSPGTTIDLAPHVSGLFTSVAPASAPAHGTIVQTGTLITYTPARGYSGPDSFTYTASGPGGTSAPATVSISVAGRPDPSKDPDVIGLVTAEVGAMQRFGQAQIDNVGQRLDALHGDDIAPVTNGLSVANGSQLPFDAQAYIDNLGAKPVAAAQGINRQFPAGQGRPQIVPPQFYVWTGGSISFGNQSVTGNRDNHFTTTGVSVGIDTRFADGLKGGIALGFGSDRSRIGVSGTRADSNFYSATAYASWRVVPQTFLDATFGVGRGSFDTQRFVPAEQIFVFGKRDGTNVFGSLALTYENKWGDLKFAPYARVDAMRINLSSSTETGSDIWALTYRALSQTSVSGALGIKTQYPIEMSWGTLTPTTRLEYRHSFDSDFKQVLNYADQPAGPFYTLSGQARARDTFAATIGLQAQTLNNVKGSVEYQVSASPQKVETQTLRAQVSVGF